MKKLFVETLLAVGAILPLAITAGCQVEAYPTGGPVVAEAPPPDQAEVAVGVAPGPNYVWINGYWGRDHDHWAWQRGRWERRPHPGAVWTAGRWDRHNNDYQWHDGHWH